MSSRSSSGNLLSVDMAHFCCNLCTLKKIDDYIYIMIILYDCVVT